MATSRSALEVRKLVGRELAEEIVGETGGVVARVSVEWNGGNRERNWATPAGDSVGRL